MARRFENALKQNGVKVEAKYYDGAGHNAIFTDRAQYQDSVKRIAEFLQQR
jgi:dipeptidyl aminopeptidase/acylaminoacyl peptidase